VVSQSSNKVQIMDLETFETIDVPIPTEEELKSKLQSGAEVEYWVAMGKMKIVRVKNA
jgi:translation initiation factor 5A